MDEIDKILNVEIPLIFPEKIIEATLIFKKGLLLGEMKEVNRRTNEEMVNRVESSLIEKATNKKTTVINKN